MLGVGIVGGECLAALPEIPKSLLARFIRVEPSAKSQSEGLDCRMSFYAFFATYQSILSPEDAEAWETTFDREWNEWRSTLGALYEQVHELLDATC